MPTARLIYADSERCADMRYATGMFVPDPFIWAAIGRTKMMIVSPLEIGRASLEAPRGTKVIAIDAARREFKARDARPSSLIAALTRAFKIRRWEVPGSFPVGLAQALGKRRVTVRAAKGAFFPKREFKTKREIAMVKEGEQLAEAGLDVALDIVAKSKIRGGYIHWRGELLTSERLRGEIDATISRLCGIAANTIVASGSHGADPHNCGSGPIPAHSPLIFDIFPRVTATGYFGDLTRTVVKGKATPVVKRAFAAVRKARNHAKRMIKPGIKANSVHNAVHEIFAAAGFATDAAADPPHGFFHGTGHGVGLEIHEAPRLSTLPNVLRRGQVVTVEPGVYYRDWGGMRLEDVVAISPGGCQSLTSVSSFLEIP